MSAIDPKRTQASALHMSAFDPKRTLSLSISASRQMIGMPPMPHRFIGRWWW